jgi:predicted Zn-dependent protease
MNMASQYGITAAFASVGLQQINSPGKYAAARLGADLALDAWQNGYGRSLEDQADRVGLRYAFEAGSTSRKAHGCGTVFESEMGS